MPTPLKPSEARLRVAELRVLARTALDGAEAAAGAGNDRLAAILDAHAATCAREAADAARRAIPSTRSL